MPKKLKAPVLSKEVQPHLWAIHMTSWGGAYPDVWGIRGMPTLGVQGEMSRLRVIMKASDWSAVPLLAATGTWVRASVNLWRTLA